VPGIVVASFNLHGGMDGWGRPYDAVAACAVLDADVLVLQENFAPGAGAAGGADGAGLAGRIAAGLGYEVRTCHLAEARSYGSVPGGRGFGPPPWVHRPVGLRVALARRPPKDEARRSAWDEGERGSWGVALLTRLPVLHFEELDLGQLRRDPAHRRALLVEVDTGAGGRLAVAGVHMSHLSDGSATQFRRLARALPPSPVDTVLAGDMNCWGPPLRLLMPGWRRAVRGRTWPAPRPLAQIDHVLVRPGMKVAGASVVRLGASDHRAVRVELG
jgi:endonuclease/exonuclease/phosphatase family metal-dependent hydrolase